MMRFAAPAQLRLDATVEHVIPGELHPDGRRYLPRLLLQLHDVGPHGTPATQLLIVDRHHVSIATDWRGRPVHVALLCALSSIRRQTPPYRDGWLAPSADRAFGDLPIAGQITAVPIWEAPPADAAFPTVYCELLLRIGSSLIGVKTGLPADDQPPLQPGDWIELLRSRIDLLQIRAAEGAKA
jgi:hypothetical protein